MRVEIKKIYESTEEVRKAIEDGTIRVEDELITKDTDGEAVYVVADISEDRVSFVRKFVLEDSRPMKTRDFDLIQWLNDEYANSLDEDLKAMMIAPEGQQLIDLPREIEVFARNEYGTPEGGYRWEYFKKLGNRICGTGDDAEYSKWWWMNTRHKASAANFCFCGSGGRAYYDGAGGAGIYVRPRFILASA